MTKLFIRTAFTAIVCGSLAAPAFAQQVSVTLKDGLVSIKADNATIRQVLDEWARVGGAKVINSEKLAGTMLTLSLVNVPERQALDTILRGTSGYLAVDRTTPSTTASASSYERIVVMNKTVQAVTSVASSGPSTTTPTYVPPAAPDAGVDTEELAAARQNAMEPPTPTDAPVQNPYAQGAAGAGVGMATNGAGAAYSNGTAQGANGNTVTANPADVKFDYANPVPYFEAQRQLQQQQQQATQQQQTQPTSTPGGTTLTSQPGIAPTPTPNVSTPTTNTNTPNQNFNPYNPPANFNPYNLKPGETIPGTTPQNVTPDRSKYANPYQPQPQQP